MPRVKKLIFIFCLTLCLPAVTVFLSTPIYGGCELPYLYTISVSGPKVCAGSGILSSVAECPSGYQLTDCSRWNSFVCDDDRTYGHFGTYPIGNERCQHSAGLNSCDGDFCIKAYAQCAQLRNP